jgi:hypothetical protein
MEIMHFLSEHKHTEGSASGRLRRARAFETRSVRTA